MSVEIEGPKGYEYQYLATAYITLIFLNKSVNAITLFIEKKGGEDAELELKNNAQTLSLEIQCKKHKEDIDLDNLTKWLFHSAKDKKNFLLNRLKTENNKHAVFITTARCSDEVRYFINEDENTFSQVTLPKKIKKSLLEYLGKFNNGEYKFISDEFKNTPSLFDDVINRIHILEKLTKLDLENKIEFILNKNFKIPLSEIQSVLSKIIDIIRLDGRDKQKDIVPDLLSTINKYKGDAPINFAPYYKRSEEDELLKILNTKNSLLLTGINLCGKSKTALYLSSLYYNQGYKYKHMSDIGEAIRFIQDTTIDDRICYLEDPLGHFYYNSIESQEKWRYIQGLLKVCSSSRIIIITSNTEVIKMLDNLSRDQWYDLTLREKNTSIAIWKNICLQKGNTISETIKNKITEYLNHANIDDILQPGQLDYLSNNSENINNFSKDSIRHFATVNIDNITEIIKHKSENCERVIRVLALLGNTIIPISIAELAYIFSQDETLIGVYNKKDHIDFSSESDREPVFPEYTNATTIPYIYQAELDFLQERGYINYTNKAYIFRHPIYFEAARKLMKDLPLGKFNILMEDLKKAISTISATNSLHASKQLAFLYNNTSNYDQKISIVEIGMLGFRSIFPAIQDSCLSILAKLIPELPENFSQSIQTRIASNNFSIVYVYWHNEEPFIHQMVTVTGSRMVEVEKEKNKKYNYEEWIRLFETNTQIISPKNAWLLASYIERKSLKNPLKIPSIVLDKMLSYDEVFIREIASYHIMRIYKNPSIRLVEKVFNDEHPFVVFEAIKGSIRGWNKYNDHTRNFVLGYIEKAFDRDDVLISSTHFMTQFGIGYSGASFDWRDHIKEEAKKDMWLIWAKLLPIFFKRIPSHIRFSEGRFWSTMQKSMDIIDDINLKINITEAWIEYLEKGFRENYENMSILGVVEYFFHFFKQALSIRTNASIKLINQENILFAANNIRCFITNWKQLNSIEKDAIIKRLTLNPETILKPVALTTKNIPKELLTHLIPNPDIFSQPPEGIINSLPPVLIKKCIVILYLDYNYKDLAYSNIKYWNPILEYYLLKPGEDLFKVAFKVIFEDYAYNGPGSKSVWGNIPKRIEQLLKLNNDIVTKWCHDLIIKNLTEANYSTIEKVFNTYVKTASPENYNLLLNSIKSNLEAIASNNNLEIIDNIFSKEIFTTLDEYSLLVQILNKKKSANIISIKILFEKLMTTKKIRLLRTLDLFKNYLAKNQEEMPNLDENIRAYKNYLFDVIQKQDSQCIKNVISQLEPFEKLIND